MEVYVALGQYGGASGPSEVYGVFSTLEAAKAALDLERDLYGHTWTERWDVSDA